MGRPDQKTIHCRIVPIGNPIRDRRQLGSGSLEAKDCRKPSVVKGTGRFPGAHGRLWPTVPLVNPELSKNMGLAHFHKPPPIDVQSAARAGWRFLVIVPHTRRSSGRKPGPPPPDRCPPALSQKATEADRSRPYSVGVTMRRLERLAICFRDRQAGNGRRLASGRLSPFLDMEDPTRPSRTTSSSKRDP
jgi:hypothetical protein